MPTVECTEKASGQSAVLEFFGLREQPFGVTPDPRFLYLTASHREALASLVYAIESKRGFSTIIAEPGMGKTTLIFHLLDKLKSTARTAFLFRPDSNTRELLQSLLLDLGLEADTHDVPQMHETLKSALLEDLRAGKHFVWVIDEAQDLDSEVLESIRLLSNFETPVSKLMHILLAGQPQLAEKLASPELLQLRQRVSTMAQLSPLTMRETSGYIHFRMRRAGSRNEAIFSSEASALIARASLGIPRNINHLCFSCMSLAFVEGHKIINPEIVSEVLAERERERENAKAPPSIPAPPEPASAPFLPALPDPLPGRSSFWTGFFLIGFLLLPFLLIAMETNSRLAVLETVRGPLAEDLIARMTGYNIHMPDPPDLESAALKPPKPPMPLPDSSQRTLVESAGYIAPAHKKNASLHQRSNIRADIAAPAKKPSNGPSRVVFARGGESLFTLAYQYYGKSNGVIVARIQSHNPQIKSLYTALLRNQPVVLPDLAPEFPWKSSSPRVGN